MQPGFASWMAALGAVPAEGKARLIEEALGTPAGRAWKRAAGEWVVSFTPVDWLVPAAAARWRPLIADALAFVFSRLSDARLAAKIAEQLELPADTPPQRRLTCLLSRMPALQKIGQVLARNRRLAPEVRQALTELENGITDMTPADVHARIVEGLGDRLARYEVELDAGVLSEASVSAVVRFTWRRPDRERERGVLKAMKPYVRACFAEDVRALQALGRRVARRRGYGFAAREIDEMLTEVRLLLERELDFEREQAILAEAAQTYRSMLGVRVPRVIPELSTPEITAMTEENGVKVTDAVRRSPVRQARVATQLVDALIAAPLLSGQKRSVFHADPHAGNLLYDEANRELIVLDWALAEHLTLETRRRLVMLGAMMTFENADGVREAIRKLRRPGKPGAHAAARIIDAAVARFFDRLPAGASPGVLDAMRLLDQIALQGVSFAAPLFLFRKSLFTLDGVLRDVAGSEVRMDSALLRQFLTRWAASFGLFYSPLGLRDLLAMEWNAVTYPARAWLRPHI